MEYIVKTIFNAVEIGTTLNMNWFRGHSKIIGDLVPKAFRRDYKDSCNYGFYKNMELYNISEFKRRAFTLADNCPNEEDNVSWLLLMQHYGMPTRILDWSESVLVALFFAVKDDFDHDGELWSVFPLALNKKSEINGFPHLKDPHLLYLFNEPFLTEQVRRDYEAQIKISKTPIAFYPSLRFTRAVSQLSVMTIHTKSESDELTKLLPDAKDLVRYIIPREKKQILLWNLKSLGVTHSVLFPNMDSLSKDLLHNNKLMAYKQPDPPCW